MRIAVRVVLVLVMLVSGVTLSSAVQDPQSGVPQDPQRLIAQNLKRLSIEELTQLDVTSASRRIEPLARVAAAVSVIRGEDIRRSGAASLPEALRLADGIAVARADNTTWAISTRGFNISTANKLLVLIDGRSVYSPLFAGTFWSVQDLPLASIDRIEVIRGPGGALWGANAVNGVVNIITKSSADTKGTQIVLGAGTEERGIATVQHGGGATGFDYRVYGKFRARDAQVLSSGVDANDEVKMGQTGFRLDSTGRGRDTWLVQGDAYGGREGLFNVPDTHVGGGNVMGRWARRFSPGSQLRTQIYFDHVHRSVYQQFRETRNTLDLEVQQQFTRGRHDVIAGGNARVWRGNDRGNASFHFDPEVQTSTVAGLFAHDEISIVPRRLALIVGSKFERNSFTGIEAQPSVRVRWTPAGAQTVWGAVSRAVRLPTRFDTDLRLTDPASGAITLTGSVDFATEKVLAYEAGYRAEAARLSLDIAGYINRYGDLRSEEFPPAGVNGPVVLQNLMNARTWGSDVSATLLIVPQWRVHAGYSYLHEAVDFDARSRDLTQGVNEYNDPSHVFKLRSNIDLPGALELDSFFRRVGRLPHPEVAAYSELDTRFGWRPSARWEVSLIGQSLLHRAHREFRLAGPLTEEFQRGVYARILWRF